MGMCPSLEFFNGQKNKCGDAVVWLVILGCPIGLDREMEVVC